MKTKILKYGAYPRHNEVVTAYADVTFLNDYVGYTEGEKCDYNHDFDAINIILRVGKVAFEADTACRKDMQNEMYFTMMSERASGLHHFVAELMNTGKYVSLIYIAVFDALGWDSRHLQEYRDEYLRRKEEKERREQAEKECRREQERCVLEEEWNKNLEESRKRFDMGDYIDVEYFIGLCERAGIDIHPRTKGTLTKSITDVSKTKIRYIPKRNCRAPSPDGCFKLVEQLISYYNVSKSSSNT